MDDWSNWGENVGDFEVPQMGQSNWLGDIGGWLGKNWQQLLGLGTTVGGMFLGGGGAGGQADWTQQNMYDKLAKQARAGSWNLLQPLAGLAAGGPPTATPLMNQIWQQMQQLAQTGAPEATTAQQQIQQQLGRGQLGYLPEAALPGYERMLAQGPEGMYPGQEIAAGRQYLQQMANMLPQQATQMAMQNPTWGAQLGRSGRATNQFMQEAMLNPQLEANKALAGYEQWAAGQGPAAQQAYVQAMAPGERSTMMYGQQLPAMLQQNMQYGAQGQLPWRQAFAAAPVDWATDWRNRYMSGLSTTAGNLMQMYSPTGMTKTYEDTQPSWMNLLGKGMMAAGPYIGGQKA